MLTGNLPVFLGWEQQVFTEANTFPVFDPFLSFGKPGMLIACYGGGRPARGLF